MERTHPPPPRNRCKMTYPLASYVCKFLSPNKMMETKFSAFFRKMYKCRKIIRYDQKRGNKIDSAGRFKAKELVRKRPGKMFNKRNC